jgi:glutathione S-transferase
MKLYLATGACSLADHIALNEAELPFDMIKVDLATHKTETGEDYFAINPKGYIPLLVLDDGQTLTENAAILCWIADQAPRLAPAGELGRMRLIEELSFIAAELHKPFIRSFFPVNDAERDMARHMIRGRLDYLDGRLADDYLFGAEMSVADAYLFVMLRWAQASRHSLSPALAAFLARMTARPAVARALAREGLA